jgi:predicted amidophosphoribosyltransferase
MPKGSSSRCLVCGKEFEGGTSICPTCAEKIRGEAVGEQKKVHETGRKEQKKYGVSEEKKG